MLSAGHGRNTLVMVPHHYTFSRQNLHIKPRSHGNTNVVGTPRVAFRTAVVMLGGHVWSATPVKPAIGTVMCAGSDPEDQNLNNYIIYKKQRMNFQLRNETETRYEKMIAS